jgi:hypothetical protein
VVESPALRVLSIHAIRVMHRLEHEDMSHGCAENGRLIVTHDQFVGWGVERKQIAHAIRELVALGFIEIMERGYAGAAGHGKANRFRLTYLNTKTFEEPSHDWRRIGTIEEANATAKVALSDKDSRAADKGRRSAKGRITANRTAKPAKTISVPETGTTWLSSANRNFYLYLGWASDSVEPLLPTPAQLPAFLIDAAYVVAGSRARSLSRLTPPS